MAYEALKSGLKQPAGSAGYALPDRREQCDIHININFDISHGLGLHP